MRTLRLSLAGTVILVLLGGVTGIASAQDKEAATWTHVTGQTNMDDEWVEVETAGASRWDGSVEYQEVSEYIMPMEWSDPRLGESMHLREQAVLHTGDPASWEDDMWVFARAVRLEGPQGAWLGSAGGVAANDLSTTQMQYELTGEGAYEGLSAVFAQDNSGWPIVQFDGWIFEGDLPTMPEPVMASPEEAAGAEPTEDSSAIGATDGPAVESDTGPEAVAALVTGTEVCTGGEVETTQMEGYTLLHATGPEGHCTIAASDPRVSGTSTEGDMWDACFLMGPNDPPFYPSGCIYWGEYGIDGPDGRWVGTWTGVDDPALGKASYLILLEGTDAYEGWSFVAHWLDPFTGAPLTFSGLIYEGPLPPWEPPAE